MPWGATTFLVPPIAGHFIGRFGVRPFVVAGLGLHAAAMVWIAVLVDDGLGYGQLIAPLVVSGTGVALSLPATQAAALSGVGPRSLGAASGAYSTMRQLGGAFGVAVVVATFLTAGSYASPRTFVSGFSAALWACAALSLVGALTGLAARRSSAPIGRPASAHRVAEPTA
ncbi:MFS transporter [Cryptosporangium japonicum]|uniref:Major facilitator superfamily (MFS) profile domain-containing protein n=1 Tax=Cryptosporangium japonicum TaxID=80872 RepID=A0ABN0V2E9_9ACTN